MASSTEEVSANNDISTDSKQHDTTDTEQKFGMYMREFDFLEYELESLEVKLINFQLKFKLCDYFVYREKVSIISTGVLEDQVCHTWKELLLMLQTTH